MPRSSLLNALMRIAADVDRARRPARPVGWGPKIERRAALRGAASLAGMALLPRLPALAAAEARVAIVGAGLAGLTAAYELSKAGLKPDVYEGSTRLGGRCYSIKFRDNGQIAEHGGEFINTGQIRRSRTSLGSSAWSSMIPTTNMTGTNSGDLTANATPASRRQRITRSSTR